MRSRRFGRRLPVGDALPAVGALREHDAARTPGVHAVARCSLKVARAWEINDLVMRLWNFRARGWAEWVWRRWYACAVRGRLEAIKNLARRDDRCRAEERSLRGGQGQNAVEQVVRLRLSQLGWLPQRAVLPSRRARPRPGRRGRPHEVPKRRGSKSFVVCLMCLTSAYVSPAWAQSSCGGFPDTQSWLFENRDYFDPLSSEPRAARTAVEYPGLSRSLLNFGSGRSPSLLRSRLSYAT